MILVIGSSGLIGSKFVKDASKLVDVIGVDENILDITDKGAVDKFFKEESFNTVINFAAVTNVDGAEKERNDKSGLCYKLNVIGVENLTQACKKHGKFLIQISTDFVFQGTDKNPGPYDELSPIAYHLSPNMGWYGYTKSVAELRVTGDGLKSAIVRIAYPFYPDNYKGKLDFAKNYLKLFDENKLFPIFTDQIFTPILVDDLVEPLVKIAKEKLSGTFHIVSSNTVTPFEFVEYLLKKARNVEGVVQKASMQEFLKAPGRTPRSRLGGLKTKITQKKLGMKFKTWQEMVDEFVYEFSS